MSRLVRCELAIPPFTGEMDRVIDWLFVIYFIIHIPIFIFIDSQTLLPRNVYPKLALDLIDWYTANLKDSMMVLPPVWYKSFCFSEAFLQFPFFIVAAYVYWSGVSKHKWIRLPSLIYATHVMTVLLGILSYIGFNDFSKDPIPGPSTMEERLTLVAIYIPFFIVPLILFIDTLLSNVYTSGGKSNKKKRN